jgi:hypothetical protein
MAGFKGISAGFCRFLLRGCMYTLVKVRRLEWVRMNFLIVKSEGSGLLTALLALITTFSYHILEVAVLF